MTKASAGRNARRGKDLNELQKIAQQAYLKGRIDFAGELMSPVGFKMPDGRIARMVIEGAGSESSGDEKHG